MGRRRGAFARYIITSCARCPCQAGRAAALRAGKYCSRWEHRGEQGGGKGEQTSPEGGVQREQARRGEEEQEAGEERGALVKHFLGH